MGDRSHCHKGIFALGKRELIVIGIMSTIWGLHFVVMKVAVEIVPPIFYAAIRMTIVAILMAAFIRWRRGEMKAVFIAGVCFGALNYAFMFTGIKFASASATAVAIELYVPFATILSVVFLHEKIGWRRVFGISLAFSGVALIALGGSGENSETKMGLGVGFVALGAFAEAVGSITVKRIKSFKPHELLAWFAVIGAVVLWPLSFIFEDGQHQAILDADLSLLIATLIYSTIGASIIGHSAYYWLLQRLPVSTVATTTLLTSVIAITSGVLILGDPFGVLFIAGGAAALLGVAIVMIRTPDTSADKPSTIEIK